jgi:hypothetical protein
MNTECGKLSVFRPEKLKSWVFIIFVGLDYVLREKEIFEDNNKKKSRLKNENQLKTGSYSRKLLLMVTI